jgi:hypothetical protein
MDEAAVFTRMTQASQDFSEAPARATAAEEWDEVDRLFRGAPPSA